MSQIRAVRIYNYVSRLRKAIRMEGTPTIQAAWDKLEPHVDIFLQAAHDADNDGPEGRAITQTQPDRAAGG